MFFIASKIRFFSKIARYSYLALPLGELSLQATERAADKSPPAERVNGIPHLALPLGELSAKLTERVYVSHPRKKSYFL